MRVKNTNVYQYEELSDKAKERAREWYREGCLDYDWWDCIYDDIAERAKELGIDLRQKPVKLMGGGTRYDPEIYFSGFYHQGSGSSFAGTWYANTMHGDTLRKECPTETELHRILSELETIAKEDPDMSATITAQHDTWINVEVCDGEEASDTLDELDYDSPEYKALSKVYREREDAVIEALRDFNHWIYKRLESEYEYLTSDEQVEESITANEYEFTEDGKRF